MPSSSSVVAPQDTRRSARPSGGAGDLVKLWRQKRRLSQLALALDAGVSSRHLSFVETGRAAPSPELILRLSETLRIPLRARNELLLAGGFAPVYPELSLTASPLMMVKDAMQRLLDAHDPYPGVALDRRWNVLLMNSAAQRLMAMLPPRFRTPSINMFRAGLHPDGFAAITTNFAQWGRYMIDELQQLADATLDDGVSALLAEVREYPNVKRLLMTTVAPRDVLGGILVPCELAISGARLSLFTTLATLGSPRDVTLAELTVELFYPSDASTAETLRAMASE